MIEKSYANRLRSGGYCAYYVNSAHPDFALAHKGLGRGDCGEKGPKMRKAPELGLRGLRGAMNGELGLTAEDADKSMMTYELTYIVHSLCQSGGGENCWKSLRNRSFCGGLER